MNYFEKLADENAKALDDLGVSDRYAAELYHALKFGAPIEIPPSIGEYNNTFSRTAITTKNTLITTITHTMGTGKINYLSGLIIGSDRPVRLVIQIKQDGGFGQFFSQNGATGIGTMLYGRAQEEKDYIYTVGPIPLKLYEGGLIEIKAYSMVDGQETPYITYTPLGVRRTFDEYYTAKKTAYLLGVSIDWSALGTVSSGSGSPNRGNTIWGTRLRDYLRLNGVDIKLENMAFGQSRIADALAQIKSGKHQGIKMDLVLLHFGENNYFDGTAGATINQFKQDYRDVINFFKSSPINKDSPILVIIPGPTDVASGTSAMPIYQQAVLDIVNEYDVSKKVYFYDPSNPISIGNKLNLAVSNNVQSSDFSEKTTGTQLHWQGDTGHLKVFNGIVEKLGPTLISELD